jgi:hypothetical protein
LKRSAVIAVAAALCCGCAQQSQVAPPAGAPTLVNPAAVMTDMLVQAQREDQEKRYQQQQVDAYDRSQCISEGYVEFSAEYGQCRTRLSRQRKGIGGINPTPAGAVVDPWKLPTASGIRDVIDLPRRNDRYLRHGIVIQPEGQLVGTDAAEPDHVL